MTHGEKMRRWRSPALMLVTDRRRLRGRSLEEVVSLAVDGGVNIVQLREKDLSARELYNLALTVRTVIRGRALFLVNDRVDVASATGADGVQLPADGLPLDAAADVDPTLLFGQSVHSAAAAVEAQHRGADFVVLGTVFETASKPGARTLGLEGVRRAAEAVSIPVIAIGGITAENAGDVIDAGAGGVAVLSAIMDAPDPTAAARALWQAVESRWVGATPR
ncbi:MAG TPA: thiamine phosphate synthase [Dehalococcoidia bacterium]|nr:thiamine phosphate synthase [Dehalococcoidia bacterium]